MADETSSSKAQVLDFPGDASLGELSIQHRGRWRALGAARGRVLAPPGAVRLVVAQEGVDALAEAPLPAALHTIRIEGAFLNQRHFAAISNATALTSLELPRCFFPPQDLAPLEPLKQLVALNLAHSGFDTDGAEVLPDLFPQLRGLVADNTELSSDAAAHLTRLKNLQTLHFRNTHIDDEGFAELLASPTLRELAPNHLMTGVSWYALGKLPALESLLLDNVQLSPDEAASFYELKALRMLSLGEAMGDDVVARLNLLSGLRMAWLESARLTHIGLAGLRGCGELEMLIWQSTTFGVDEANALVSHPRLARLAMVRADFALESLDALSYQKQLREVRMRCPELVDDMVGSFAGFAHLERLELFGTRLTADGLDRLQALLPKTEISLGRDRLVAGGEASRPQWGRIYSRSVRSTGDTPWVELATLADVRSDAEVSYRAFGVGLSDLVALARHNGRALAELVAESCTMTGPDAGAIPGLLALKTVEAPELDAPAEAWQALAALPNLRRLVVPRANLRAADLSALMQTGFRALEHLDLRDVEVGDALLTAATRLPNLAFLDVVRCGVTAPAVERFRAQRPQVHLLASDFPQASNLTYAKK